MGRPKTYDPNEVAARAMDVFWTEGFRGASLAALERGTGVNRFGLYADFGSKRGLLEAALNRYVDEVVPVSLGGLQSDDSGVAEIREVVLRFAGASGTERGRRGCMMCNMATELGSSDESLKRPFRRYTDAITAAFRSGLRGARARGELPPHLDPDSEAHLWATAVIGMFVLVKGGGDPALLATSSRLLLARLEVGGQAADGPGRLD